MEEIDPIGRIPGLCGGCAGAAGGCLALEGVLLTASEILARGRGGAAVGGRPVPPVALDLMDETEVGGETTEEREFVFSSAGEPLDELEDSNDGSKVEVRDLGVGAPVAEGALGGSIDDLLLGGAGPELLDEAMVAVLVRFVEGVGFFAEDEVAVLERGEEGDAVVALPRGTALTWPALNVVEPAACAAHG